jgi:hypothetical protein
VYGLRDLRGHKFGKLLVLDGFGKNTSTGKMMWRCRCDCGTVVEVRHDYLMHTNCPKTHCGCVNKGPSVLKPLEYAVWSMMLKRCEDPTHVAYKHYGGRGIKVCEAWHDFDTFCKDMGPRKSRDMTLERERVNEGYQPDNCSWLSKSLQGRNKRNTIRLPHPQTGLPVPAAEVAEFLGVSYQSMRAQYVAEGRWPTTKAEDAKQ